MFKIFPFHSFDRNHLNTMHCEMFQIDEAYFPRVSYQVDGFNFFDEFIEPILQPPPQVNFFDYCIQPLFDEPQQKSPPKKVKNSRTHFTDHQVSNSRRTFK